MLINLQHLREPPDADASESDDGTYLANVKGERLLCPLLELLVPDQDNKRQEHFLQPGRVVVS